MPRTTPALDKINAVGLDQLCDWFADGRSQTDIARELGINQSHLSHWIAADPTRSARVNMCRELGAEVYEEQAWAELDIKAEMYANPQLASSLVQLARERAQSCWRRASVRSPKYSDKRTSEVNVNVRHDIASIPTIELERMVQTLHLDNDTGEVSDH
jgi:hypothetical protein